jgi:peptidyl-dipeptidase A
MSWKFLLFSSLLLMVTSACQKQDVTARKANDQASDVTAEQVEAFISSAEQELEALIHQHEELAWRHSTEDSGDYGRRAKNAMQDYLSGRMRLALQTASYTRVTGLTGDAKRKLEILQQAITIPAPGDQQRTVEQADIGARLKSIYTDGEYCFADGGCLDLTQLGDIMAESRDPDLLLESWQGWRKVSPPMKEAYVRQVELANMGAVTLGFNDLGEMWRSGYDMPAGEYDLVLDSLWHGVEPLYQALHCHVRAKLADYYGDELVEPHGPMPAHLLGNMWAQDWRNIYALLQADDVLASLDVSAMLKERGLDAVGMVRVAENFFLSLGFEELPGTFWQRSMFVEPEDREVNCQASAWSIDGKDDVRIRMCIRVNAESFSSIHHEMGHTYYQRAYAGQCLLYRAGANDGFHEALGDTIALSITPGYLQSIGLLDQNHDQSDDIARLLEQALERVAFLPFGLMVDQWRWRVFAGEVSPGEYNDLWWRMKEQYQGVRAPSERPSDAFDPGAKFHIAANVPFSRYFIARILQFQMHRALCGISGFDGPLHRCSIYGSEKAGERLHAMMAMGRSQPWQDSLEMLTGQREMDASALLEYFAPLKDWLDLQNEGRQCGW